MNKKPKLYSYDKNKKDCKLVRIALVRTNKRTYGYIIQERKKFLFFKWWTTWCFVERSNEFPNYYPIMFKARTEAEKYVENKNQSL